jgi:prepilin peptidase CpaA
LELILVILAGLVLVVAAYTDVRSLTIPNYLIGILVVLALIHALVLGRLDALGWIGAVAVLLVGLLLWRLGLMGAGDVKLASAALLWLPGMAIDFLILTAILGGLLSLGYLIAGLLKKKKFDKIPYGLPLALATIAILTWNVIQG